MRDLGVIGRIDPENIPNHDSPSIINSSLPNPIGVVGSNISVYFTESGYAITMSDVVLGKLCLEVVNYLDSQRLLLRPDAEYESGTTFAITINDESGEERYYNSSGGEIWLNESVISQSQMTSLESLLCHLVESSYPGAIFNLIEFGRVED